MQNRGPFWDISARPGSGGGKVFWMERFAFLDGEVCFSGWRGLLFWMERVAFLDGEVCFSGWRGLFFLDGEGCFLDGEVYFSGWRGRGLLDAEGPKVGIELNLEITKDKDRLQK